MRFFISAGEPSGDLHGANLIEALRARVPGAEFVGYGGPKMREAGAALLYPLWLRGVWPGFQVALRGVWPGFQFEQGHP